VERDVLTVARRSFKAGLGPILRVDGKDGEREQQGGGEENAERRGLHGDELNAGEEGLQGIELGIDE